MLKSYGFEIHEASSGKDAIELVKEHVYDMIFMDHMTPEMDGIEATRILRSECGKTAKNTRARGVSTPGPCAIFISRNR